MTGLRFVGRPFAFAGRGFAGLRGLGEAFFIEASVRRRRTEPRSQREGVFCRGAAQMPWSWQI